METTAPVTEEKGKGDCQLKGFTSNAIYRMMPEYEADKVMRAKGPQPNKHFWSPTAEYVGTYMSSGGKTSTSSVLIKIPLRVSYKEFLDAVAKKGELHPHNMGSNWDQCFPGKKKASVAKGMISVKADGGTATIYFDKPLPEYIKAMMGEPERVQLS